MGQGLADRCEEVREGEGLVGVRGQRQEGVRGRGVRDADDDIGHARAAADEQREDGGEYREPVGCEAVRDALQALLDRAAEGERERVVCCAAPGGPTAVGGEPGRGGLLGEPVPR
ncbi:hypothetical protein [Streptomyces cirratus]|uniref:hypothetical protein n=1 Tax=Streptomyces cirratus TaxID=68187 RepID=UPI0036185AC6